MVTITLKNGYQLKYYGQININIHDRLITISAHSNYPRVEAEELDVWSSDVYDWLFPFEVMSIEGRDG